ncbi:MAG: Gamma-glutamyltranspeptidase precursor [Pseudomonadota bacterium]|jgi:gamma-glutamyltranspeptidase/glutathione hydrolase
MKRHRFHLAFILTKVKALQGKLWQTLHVQIGLCIGLALASLSSAAQVAYLDLTQNSASVAVTTAHPWATEAALKMLKQGGSATDAAIAAQLMLGLVEPQSSGLGGGSFFMHWHAGQKALTSFDGLAAAPQKVTESLTTDVDGSKLPAAQMARGGRSAGVPGTLPLLVKVHAQFGKLPWAHLFAPAIEAASKGFPMPAYMHQILAAPGSAEAHPDLLHLYFDDSQKVKAIGSPIVNLDYAQILQKIASQGPSAVWTGEQGASFMASLQKGYKPSLIALDDLRNYKVEERQALCGPYLLYKVCVMAPPSFGGVVVLQMLQMMEAKTANTAKFNQPEFAHIYAEAGKLAQSDRQRYVADPGYFQVPAKTLVANNYLRQRAQLIQEQTLPAYSAGQPLVASQAARPSNLRLDLTPAAPSSDATSQLAVVDAAGNAVSMTTTNNLNFGSRLLTQGYILNNAMTNFASNPKPGEVSPNKMEPGKRPVTSMAPTMVFDDKGQLITVGGSAGGGQIVDYVSANLIRMLALDQTPVEALSQGHISTAIPQRVQLEKGTAAAQLAEPLQAKGHKVEVVPMNSGMGFLKRSANGWIGAADPRRDGAAWGFNPTP